MSALITYEGGHQDHETTPQEFKIGENGKPDRRKGVEKPAQTRFFEAKSVNIRGMVFDKGVARPCAKADVIAKAQAMGCFKVEDVEKHQPKPKASKE